MTKKGIRPQRHYRCIKTKKGRKRILINPKIKKKKRIKRKTKPKPKREQRKNYTQGLGILSLGPRTTEESLGLSSQPQLSQAELRILRESIKEEEEPEEIKEVKEQLAEKPSVGKGFVRIFIRDKGRGRQDIEELPRFKETIPSELSLAEQPITEIIQPVTKRPRGRPTKIEEQFRQRGLEVVKIPESKIEPAQRTKEIGESFAEQLAKTRGAK